jgi:PAS domain-containing protein
MPHDNGSGARTRVVIPFSAAGRPVLSRSVTRVSTERHRPSRLIRSAALLAGFVASLHGCATTRRPPSRADTVAAVIRVEGINDDYWRFLQASRPEVAARANVPVTRLPDPTLDRAKTDAQFARAGLAALDQVFVDALPQDSYVSWQSLRWELEALAGWTAFHWTRLNDLSPGQSVFDRTIEILQTQQVADPGAGQRYLGLVNSVSDLASRVRFEYGERAHRGIRLPRDAIQRAVAHVRGLIAPADASPFGMPPGFLLLVASSELPGAFYTGTLTASLVILALSVLLWLVVSRQVKRLITRPIRRLEELSRQVTREENYALRARRGNADEIGSLAEAFNTMLSRMEAREQQLKRARDDTQQAFDQAQLLAEETRHSNRKLELEVQVRSKIEKKLTGFQKYLNSIIDSMPSALIALDEQLYVTQWNQEASSLSGTRLDEALNQPIFLAFPPLKPFLPQLKRTVEQHKVEKIERVAWGDPDAPHYYALTFYPLSGSAGRGVVIRVDDITQRLSL